MIRRRMILLSSANTIDANDCLTFVAIEDGLSVSYSMQCSYCVDYSNNWEVLDSGVGTPTINKGQALSFKARSSSSGTFTTNKRCNVEGNPLSILSGASSTDMPELFRYTHIVDASKLIIPSEVGQLRRMFANCESLVSAPELPATTLKSDCYYEMFKGCKSLVDAPRLPAVSVASDAYYGMFNGCTSLVNAPELPATMLKFRCYHGMFANCTSLVNAPELPAINLESGYCYEAMFSGCTSLVNAPELPATIIGEYCYSNMFLNCTSLVNAPELPATTLKSSCYYCMFSGCTSLVNAPELPATIIGEYCYSNMFLNCTSLSFIKMLAVELAEISITSWVQGVSPTGTFVKNAAATWDVVGNSGIPEGWTVETVTV